MSNTELLLSILAGIALAACCGFRVFVPLLVAACGLRFGVLPAEWIEESTRKLVGHDLLIAALTVATVLEIAAYKIPFLDNALDMLATPLAIGAATLLSSSFFTFADEPYMRFLLGAVTGGVGAGLIQASTAAVRAGSSKFTLGWGNPLFAIAETVVAFAGSLLALLFPLLGIAFILAACWAALWVVRKLARRVG